MSDYYLYAREPDFDWQHDALPDNLLFVLGDQLERARAILRKRNLAEIDYAVDSLDWLLRESSVYLRREIDEQLKTQESVFENRVKALKAAMPHIDIDNQSHLPDATWAEYFAVFTLALIGEVLFLEKERRRNQALITKPNLDRLQIELLSKMNRLDFTCEYAVESMEAVCFAECLRENLAPAIESSEPPEKKTISLRNSEAPLARHSKTHQLFRELLIFYRDGNHANYSAAVDAFLETIPPERVHHIKATNRRRNLTEGLSQLVRGIRQLPEIK